MPTVLYPAIGDESKSPGILVRSHTVVGPQSTVQPGATVSSTYVEQSHLNRPIVQNPYIAQAYFFNSNHSTDNKAIAETVNRSRITNPVSDHLRHTHSPWAIKEKPIIKEDPWHLPRPFEDFVGRKKQLEDLQSLKNNRESVITVCIVGAAGSGKTQLANYFSHLLHESREYDRIIWFSAESNLMQQFEEYAREELQIANKDNETLLKRFYQSREGRKSLIIFDNVEDYNTLRKQTFIPKMEQRGQLHFILTSRAAKQWPRSFHMVPVESFNPHEVSCFFNQFFKETHPEYSKDEKLFDLAEELGALPLALTQAAVYMYNEDVNAETYLELYSTRQKTLLNPEDFEDPHKGTVYVTYNLILNKVKEQSKSATLLLHYCSFMASRFIPKFMLQDILEMPDAYAFNQQANLLKKYSLIEQDVTADYIKIHPLIKEIIFIEMDLKDRISLGNHLLAVFCRLFPTDEHSYLPKLVGFQENILLPHALNLYKLITRIHTMHPAVAEAKTTYSTVAGNSSQRVISKEEKFESDKAEVKKPSLSQVFQFPNVPSSVAGSDSVGDQKTHRNLGSDVSSQGEKNPPQASSLSINIVHKLLLVLGLLHFTLGLQIYSAYPEVERIVSDEIELLDMFDDDVSSNLKDQFLRGKARLLLYQGKLDAAYTICDQLNQKLCGKNPHVWFWLGKIYCARREFEKAIAHFDHAKMLPPTWHELGAIAFGQARFDDALVYFKKAVALKKKKQHTIEDKIQLAISMRWLAHTVSVVSNLFKALQIINETINIKMDIHGTEYHRSVLNELVCKSDILFRLGRYKECWELQKKIFDMAVDLSIKRNEPDNIIKILQNYQITCVASTYAMGHYLDAYFTLKDHIDKIDEKTDVSTTHYGNFLYYLQIARVLSTLQYYESADYYFAQSEKLLRHNNPKFDDHNCVSVLMYQGISLLERNNLTQAKNCLEAVLDLQKKIYHGSNHPYLAFTLRSLARIDMYDEPEQARELLAHALLMQEDCYHTKEAHAEIAITQRLAIECDMYCSPKPNWVDIEQRLRKLIVDQELAYGTDQHAEVADTHTLLIQAYFQQSNYSAALKDILKIKTIIDDAFDQASHRKRIAIRLSLFQAYYMTGNLDGTVETLRELTTLLPHDPVYHLNYACALHTRALMNPLSATRATDIKQAASSFNQSLAVKECAQTHCDYAVFFLKEKRYPACHQQLHKASKMLNDETSIEYNTLEAIRLNTELADIVHVMSGAINISTRVMFHYLRVQLYLAENKMASAKSAYRGLLDAVKKHALEVHIAMCQSVAKQLKLDTPLIKISDRLALKHSVHSKALHDPQEEKARCSLRLFTWMKDEVVLPMVEEATRCSAPKCR